MKKDAPLIRLLETPQGYYFYETNRNEIVRTTHDVYCSIDRYAHSNATNKDMEIIHDIQEMGYMSSKRPSVIEHPSSAYLKDLLDGKMKKITLQVTQDCNLRCKYCAYSSVTSDLQRAHSQRTMSINTARKAIDFFAEHSQNSENIDIGFYGGEPFLAFNVIKDAVSYAEDVFSGKAHTYSLTSNGTILTEEIIDFIISHKFNITISLDGPKEIHDQNRIFAISNQGSFDVVMSNLEMLSQQHPTYYKTIRYNMVVDPKNDLDCFNQINMDHTFIEKDLINSVLVSTNLTDFSLDISDSFLEKNSYNQFVAYLHGLGIISSDEITSFAKSMVTVVQNKRKKMIGIRGLEDKMAPSGPCIPGVMRAMVDVDGRIFPCERCSEVSSIMCIGTLDGGFDLEKAEKILNIGQVEDNRCKECWAILHCSICAAQIADGNYFSLEKKNIRCAQVHEQIENELLDIIMLVEAERFAAEEGKKHE